MGEDTFLAAKVSFFRRMENASKHNKINIKKFKKNYVEFDFRIGTVLVIFSFF